MRYYDKKNRRLVYIEEKASPEFWDRQWEDEKLKKSILAGSKDRFVSPITKRYLKPGAKILEGGCGKGQFVYSLHTRGYDTYGVDFAEKTVKKVHTLVPELKIQYGDVRKLNFPNNTFDGYWSLGVIEHFFEGFDPIAKEMFRVLKPGGYLFLTFPSMSPLRRLKAKLNYYPTFNEQHFDRESFYQFALSPEKVIPLFESIGFKLIERKFYEGFKGLKDESGPIKPFLQSIYNSKSFFAQGICYVVSHIFAPIAGHGAILILRKTLS